MISKLSIILRDFNYRRAEKIVSCHLNITNTLIKTLQHPAAHLFKVDRQVKAHLVFAYHRHLLHRVQDVVEQLIRMRPVYLVRAFDAEIHGWRCLGSERDGYPMIVTHFASFGVACVRAGISLTNERCQIICSINEIRNLSFHSCMIYILDTVKDVLANFTKTALRSKRFGLNDGQ